MLDLDNFSHHICTWPIIVSWPWFRCHQNPWPGLRTMLNLNYIYTMRMQVWGIEESSSVSVHLFTNSSGQIILTPSWVWIFHTITNEPRVSNDLNLRGHYAHIHKIDVSAKNTYCNLEFKIIIADNCCQWPKNVALPRHKIKYLR